MSELKLKSLRDLLGKNYFIPSYQRGYRWEKRQVVDLLDDLYSFIIKKNKGEGSFYCLQPIVLKKCDEETKKSFLPDFQENCYEVIDGQQRLTTIYLLFKYLINENNFSSKLSNYGGLYNIFYQTVHGSNECIERPEKEKRDTPNDYYITQAYKEIEKWFRGRGEVKGDLLEAFESFLLYDANKTIVKKTCGYAQIIWYEVDKDVDPIKTFTRLNIGKIPLRNAELIKALFLQNRNKSNSADIQQIYIAKEWDQIEASLQEKRFWAFLNKDLKEIPNHIDFIFNVIFAVEGKKEEQAIKDNIIKSGKLEGLGSTKKINKEAEKQAKQAFNDKYGVDEYASFRFFSTKFEDALKKNEDALMQCIKNEWETVLEYYATFLDWFNNPLWYHYIGFLIYCSDPKKETEQIIKIYNLYKNSTKKEFRQKLIDEIKERLDIRLKTEGDGRSELINSAGEPIVYSDQNRTLLRQILVLYNIEHIIQKNKQYLFEKNGDLDDDENDTEEDCELMDCENDTEETDYDLRKSYVIFPFDIFKEKRWDIEHIDSFTTNPFTADKQRQKWLETALNDLKYYGKDYKTYGAITDKERKVLEDYLIKPTNFEEVTWIVSKLASEYRPEGELEKEIKNSLGNLTLLNARINRSYQNAIFPSKRKRITKEDASGEFIPICTKNVFLKNFDGVTNTNIEWNEQDMRAYQNNIIKVISKFLTKEEGGNNDK